MNTSAPVKSMKDSKANIAKNGGVETRVISIDVLRGSAVLVWGLAVVAGPWFYSLPESSWRKTLLGLFSPSIWHGMTLFDLVLPAFLVAAGAAALIDVDRRREGGATAVVLIQRIVVRALLLFLIGLVCEWTRVAGAAELRVAGIFQRIAVCYLVAGLFAIFSSWRLQALVAGVILVEYGALLELIDVPGFGVGNYSFEGNVAAYLDRLWLPGRTYYTSWDPQGLFSTLPAVATTLVGSLLGRRLLNDRAAGSDSSVGILLIGMLALNSGVLADVRMPVNASIGTPTFVLASCGSACFIVGLAGLFSRGRLSFLLSPVSAIGRNSLLLMIGLTLLPTLAGVSVWLALAAGLLAAYLFAERNWYLTLSRVVPG